MMLYDGASQLGTEESSVEKKRISVVIMFVVRIVQPITIHL